LHINFVESGYPHSHGGGGAGTYVQLISRELVRRGHRVSVVAANCPSCPIESIDEGVKVYRQNLFGPVHWYLGKIPILNSFSLAVRSFEFSINLHRFLNRLHRQNPIDLVEFSDGGDFLLALNHQIPYIVHLHGSRYTFLKMSGRPVGRSDWYERKIGLFCIRRANWIMSPSKAILDIVQDEAKVVFPNKTIIPYPLDARLLDKENDPDYFPHPNKVVLFAARNDPVKGADVLLKTIPKLTRSFPQVEFRFFGYQPSPDETIPQGVNITPFISKDQLLKEFRQAALCVVPSYWDNSPNTVYEAMAAGKAVVASRVGGIPELVQDGITGLLVKPGDPDELAAAISKLLADDLLRAKMGRAGRERIVQLADLHSNVDQRLAIYQQVIHAHRPG
jgi:glycosyltransferase involved in cell wall biosynthesis